MDRKLKTVFELCRDPMLAVKKGKIEYANSAARAAFPEAQEGKNAADLLPEEVLRHDDERYSAMTELRGRPCSISGCDLDGTRVFTLQIQDGGDLGPVSGGMIANLISASFNLQISSEQLSSRLAERSGERAFGKLLSILRHNCFSLRRQIGNLDLFYQLQTGGLLLLPKPMDLVEFCGDLADSVNMLTGDDLARVEFSSPHTALPVRMDRQALERILLNLLSNSLANTKKEDGPVRLGLSKNGDNAVFSVDDRGSGIPEEMQKDIFARYRLPLSRASLDRGATAGLGLAVVGGLVRLQGGAVLIRSKPGEGTSVHVTLPARTELTLECDSFKELRGMHGILCELSDVLDHSAYAPKYLD